MRTHLPALIVFAFAAVAACDGETGPVSSPAPYLEGGATRRVALEDALWQPELPYSQSLLNNYGFGDYGWDLLSEMRTASRAFTVEDALALAAGEPLVPGELDEILPAIAPTTEDGWRALGEKVFYTLPMRYDGYITWLASQPERLAEYGITLLEDGTVRGARVYTDTRGETRVGISCAFCHADQGISGRGNRSLDLGLARGDYMQQVGQDPSRYYGWGVGRVDVTDDVLNSPTAIPDLWALGHASHMNHSGVIALPEAETDAATTMAVRFETQYILGHRMRTRPPRMLTWGLAQFVRSLTPPRDGGPYTAAEVTESDAALGEAVFTDRCAGCHAPDRGFSGGLVEAARVLGDDNVATTPERGTGFLKVPSLLGVRGNAPYLHDGSVPDLETLLATGHPFGEPLDRDSQDALRTFLLTL